MRIFKFTCTVVLVSVMVFSGCNQGLGGRQETEDELTEDKIVLTIMSASVTETPEREVEMAIFQDYMDQNPEIIIEIIPVSMNKVTNVVTTKAIEGEMPDIFVNSLEPMQRFNDLDLCLDLSDFLEPTYLEGFYPYVLEGVTMDGEMQFMPRFTLTSAVVYRKDWFEEKGLEVPVTWDDFVEVAVALTEDVDKDGTTDRWGFAMVGSRNISGSTRFTNVLKSFGAYDVRYSGGRWHTDLDTEEGKAAFEFYGDLYNRYNVVPPGPLEVNYEDAIVQMAEEKTAMMITGQHSIGAILKQNPDLEGKLASFIIPKKDHHTSTLSIIGYSVSKDCDNVEEAIRFLKFICEKENLIKWNQATGRMPSRMDAGTDPRVDRPEYEGFYQSYDYIEPTVNVSFYAEMSDIIGETYQSILIDSLNLDTAVEAAATRIRKYIEESPELRP